MSILHLSQVQREAIQAVEQDGIVFIDEIDKIVVNQDLRYGELPYEPQHVLPSMRLPKQRSNKAVGKVVSASVTAHKE